MAARVGSSAPQVWENFDIPITNSVPYCFGCQHLQQELETVLLELQTAKKIIELLHEKTNCTVQHTSTNSQRGNTSSVSSVIPSDCKKNPTSVWKTIH